MRYIARFMGNPQCRGLVPRIHRRSSSISTTKRLRIRVDSRFIRRHDSIAKTIPPLPSPGWIQIQFLAGGRLWIRKRFEHFLSCVSVCFRRFLPLHSVKTTSARTCRTFSTPRSPIFGSIEQTERLPPTSQPREQRFRVKCPLGRTMCRCTSASLKFPMQARKAGTRACSSLCGFSSQHGISKLTRR